MGQEDRAADQMANGTSPLAPACTSSDSGEGDIDRAAVAATGPASPPAAIGAQARRDVRQILPPLGTQPYGRRQ